MPAQKYLRKKAEKLCVKGEISAFRNIDRTFKSTCSAIRNSFLKIPGFFHEVKIFFVFFFEIVA